jgi:hypothetical protein
MKLAQLLAARREINLPSDRVAIAGDHRVEAAKPNDYSVSKGTTLLTQLIAQVAQQESPGAERVAEHERADPTSCARKC